MKQHRLALFLQTGCAGSPVTVDSRALPFVLDSVLNLKQMRHYLMLTQPQNHSGEEAAEIMLATTGFGPKNPFSPCPKLFKPCWFS